MKEGQPCRQLFESKRKLKEHVQPAPHMLLRVICPFCFDKEISYNRAADLKAHVGKRHKEAAEQTGVLIDTLLSENNSYWLSVRPADYRAFVEPTERESKASVRVRTLVLEWSRRVAGEHRLREQWLRGWGEPPKDIPFVKAPPNKPVSTPYFVEEYDPKNPEVNQLTIRNISMVPGLLTATLTGDNKWYRCSLEDNILLDSKSVTSLTRKLAFLQPGEEDPGEYSIQADKTDTRRISSALGIDSKYITKIEVAECTIQEPELDLFAESEIDMGSPAPSTKAMEMSTPPYHPTPLEPRNERSPSPKRKRMEHQDTKKQSQDQINHGKRVVVLSSLDTLAPAMEKRLQPQATASKVAVKIPSAPTPSGDNTPSLPVREAPPALDQGSVQERARNLLARGCLPLMPPARRQWADVQVTLTNGSTSITWPPAQWKDLSKDQRLLELEYAAMTLVRGGSRNQLPVERAELLEEFNFLALPGTIPLSPRKLQKANLKSRVYMYQAVRAIAISETPTASDEELVSFLEGGCHRRRRTWDHLICVVDAASIPLRLKEEN